jgi:hypothetical protein
MRDPDRTPFAAPHRPSSTDVGGAMPVAPASVAPSGVAVAVCAVGAPAALVRRVVPSPRRSDRVVPSTRRSGSTARLASTRRRGGPAASTQRNALRCQSVSSHSDPAAVAVVSTPLTQTAVPAVSVVGVGAASHWEGAALPVVPSLGVAGDRGRDDLNAGLWPRGLDGFQFAPLGADSASRFVAAAR